MSMKKSEILLFLSLNDERFQRLDKLLVDLKKEVCKLSGNPTSKVLQGYNFIKQFKEIEDVEKVLRSQNLKVYEELVKETNSKKQNMQDKIDSILARRYDC